MFKQIESLFLYTRYFAEMERVYSIDVRKVMNANKTTQIMMQVKAKHIFFVF